MRSSQGKIFSFFSGEQPGLRSLQHLSRNNSCISTKIMFLFTWFCYYYYFYVWLSLELCVHSEWIKSLWFSPACGELDSSTETPDVSNVSWISKPLISAEVIIKPFALDSFIPLIGGLLWSTSYANKQTQEKACSRESSEV